MIRARAPGKVVLWGEYAVLAGAPALVMAVNRHAVCELAPGGDGWTFSARGYRAPDETLSRKALLGSRAPAPEAASHLAWQALQGTDGGRLPAGGTAILDTGPFHHQGLKLGLGSSAALCVAVYGAFCRLLEHPATYAEAASVHRRFQGGTDPVQWERPPGRDFRRSRPGGRSHAGGISGGSGIDVAAAWHGGTLKFRRPAAPGTGDTGEVTPWHLPGALHTTFVYSGAPASTSRHLERLQRWLDSGNGDELDALGAASRALFDAPDPMDALALYVAALQALDQAAGLGVFSDPHRRLGQLAIDAGVVYKPCGAGGGDIGAAFTPDAAAAGRFARLAADHGFPPLALETAPHGIEVTS